MATSDLDSRVRAAAFEFLAEQTRLHGEVRARETLTKCASSGRRASSSRRS